MTDSSASTFTFTDDFAEDSRSSQLSIPVTAWVDLGLAMAVVVGLLIWQGVVAQGVPDPLQANRAPLAAMLDIGILVFREGLECILVVSAIIASMTGTLRGHRHAVAYGAGAGFVGTVFTWFIAIGIVTSLSESVPALDLQPATGLLAVVVLLVVMNWFFHKVYWGGWIRLHHRQKKALLSGPQSARRVLAGMALLGFSAFYREGFEVVLFLQSYRLKLGEEVVLLGTLVGMGLTAVVAVFTFVAHRKLPYRKMLILTGVLLGAVLLVMVGEQAQEMQLAHWLSTTPIPVLAPLMPDWTGLWFGLTPMVETLAAQALAAALVIGSYFAARRSAGGSVSPAGS